MRDKTEVKYILGYRHGLYVCLNRNREYDQGSFNEAVRFDSEREAIKAMYKNPSLNDTILLKVTLSIEELK